MLAKKSKYPGENRNKTIYLKEYDQRTNISFLLTLYHTIPTLMTLKKKAICKPAFSPFPTVFSTHPYRNFCF